MLITRRNALYSTLFGAGYVGLRALATGIPASLLLNPRQALADEAMCADKSKAQFVIFSTSGAGDPINANVPGTYEDAKIVHSMDPAMKATSIMLAGQKHTAAAPWGTLPQASLDRTCFWHLMSNTPVHPKEPDVLTLMGATNAQEMLPSLLAKHMAPCLGTIQAQPITLGATSPSEALSYGGATLPIIPPLALKATLTSPAGPLASLQALRDDTLKKLADVYRTGASQAQKTYIDSLITSQSEVRSIKQDLLSALDSIADNTADSQIKAAITLIQMNVTPVIAIHIPFGGDNHHDTALATETAQTQSGVATIASLLAQLSSAGLSDRVTFMSLNVFGRTIGPGNEDGRQHNGNHEVSVTIGKPFNGGVIGGVGPLKTDYGAMPIDSSSGKASANGDIEAVATLASFGKTMLASVGVDSASIDYDITSGKVIAPALAK